MQKKVSEQRIILAGEYVLGTLRGPARQRFETLLKTDQQIQQIVGEWEQHFAVLDKDIPPVKPPARVWHRLRKRISAPRWQSPTRLWDNIAVWRGLSFGTLALSLALGFLLLKPFFITPPQTVEYVAVIQEQASEPIWLLHTDKAQRLLWVKVLKRPTIPTDKALELWLLRQQDQPPLSLGLLRVQGQQELKLSDRAALSKATGLAVSLEPQGGSPTGLPTGPVLYQSRLLPLI